jgi:hypothetical protein
MLISVAGKQLYQFNPALAQINAGLKQLSELPSKPN